MSRPLVKTASQSSWHHHHRYHDDPHHRHDHHDHHHNNRRCLVHFPRQQVGPFQVERATYNAGGDFDNDCDDNVDHREHNTIIVMMTMMMMMTRMMMKMTTTKMTPKEWYQRWERFKTRARRQCSSGVMQGLSLNQSKTPTYSFKFSHRLFQNFVINSNSLKFKLFQTSSQHIFFRVEEDSKLKTFQPVIDLKQ